MLPSRNVREPTQSFAFSAQHPSFLRGGSYSTHLFWLPRPFPITLAARGKCGIAAAGCESYLHGNHLGTMERMTDADREIVHIAVYTAFGELVSQGGTGIPPVDTRYGYVGAWGYQSADGDWSGVPTSDPLAELGWLYVGARYYDPAVQNHFYRDAVIQS